jgi:hypothetical protein
MILRQKNEKNEFFPLFGLKMNTKKAGSKSPAFCVIESFFILPPQNYG